MGLHGYTIWTTSTSTTDFPRIQAIGKIKFQHLCRPDFQIMDECEYLDQFLYSPSSSDVDLRQRMSGLCYNEEENNNSNCSTFSVESLAAQEDSSAVFSSESDYGFNMVMHQNFHGIGNPSNSSVPSKLGGPCNVAAPLNGNVSSSLLPYTEVGKSQSVSQSFPRDFRAISHVPHSGHFRSYEGVSSVSPGLGRDGIGGFGLHEGQYVDDDLYFMENCSSNFSTSISSKVNITLLRAHLVYISVVLCLLIVLRYLV